MSNSLAHETMNSLSTSSAPAAPVSRVGLVIDALRARIDSRALGKGAKLPSVRRLAEQHDVSKSTVVEAYDRPMGRAAGRAVSLGRATRLARRDGSRPVRARGQCGLCARPFVQLLAEMAKLHALQCRGQRRSARVRRARTGNGEGGEVRVDRIATCAASATAVRAAAPAANWSREAPDEGGRRQAPW